ncbi:Epimerase family protein [compost metagenome]
MVLLRTGLVLAADGGFLQRLLPPFKLGLGGPIGNGRQWMPWIHLQDEIGLIDFLLQRDDAHGPYNACAPQPVRNQAFAAALGQALHRPALLPLPGLLLKIALGELAGLLLGGQKALPGRAEQAGYRFRFTAIDSALADLFKDAA